MKQDKLSFSQLSIKGRIRININHRCFIKFYYQPDWLQVLSGRHFLSLPHLLLRTNSYYGSLDKDEWFWKFIWGNLYFTVHSTSVQGISCHLPGKLKDCKLIQWLQGHSNEAFLIFNFSLGTNMEIILWIFDTCTSPRILLKIISTLTTRKQYYFYFSCIPKH